MRSQLRDRLLYLLLSSPSRSALSDSVLILDKVSIMLRFNKQKIGRNKFLESFSLAFWCLSCHFSSPFSLIRSKTTSETTLANQFGVQSSTSTTILSEVSTSMWVRSIDDFSLLSPLTNFCFFVVPDKHFLRGWWDSGQWNLGWWVSFDS